MYNFLIKEVEKPIRKETLIENYKKILILMSPFIPHFTSECLANLDQKDVKWPIVSREDLIQEEINFVVQINAKKRAILMVKRDLKENEVLNEIKSNTTTKKLLKDQKIRKIIFVSNKLINIII
jgi:leucyl-tRNA synthetase